jgi:Ca2+-binding RTX toxin-like protein
MATLFARVPFQLGLFDLSALWEAGTQRTLGDDVFYASAAPPGGTYEDIFVLQPPGSDERAVFAGTGLTADGAGLLDGGTLQGVIAERTPPGGGSPEVLWSLVGIDADASLWQAAMLTDTQDDDWAALRAALAGDDLFDLRDTGPGTSLADGHVVLAGDGDDTLRGSAAADVLEGGWAGGPLDGNDSLAGNGGDDRLFGMDGSDTVEGGAGNDTIHGNAGSDLLVGGGGDDLYIVDTPTVDGMVEAAGGGMDTVWTQFAHVLAPNIETLSLLVGGSSGTGNAIANTIGGGFDGNLLDGREGNDSLSGFGGTDTLLGGTGDDVLAGDYVWPLDGSVPECEALPDDRMEGGAGNDAYYATAIDRIVERAGEGRDIVYSRNTATLQDYVEDLTLMGNRAMDGTGNALGNTITGGRGVNHLTGLEGNDLFVFGTPLGGGNVDRLTDFRPSADRIGLAATVFDALEPGALAESAFHAGPAADDADDRIVHDRTTGQLFYDADGAGGAGPMLFATLAPGTTLSATDFVIV